MEEISRKILKKDNENSIELFMVESERTELVYELEKILYPHNLNYTNILVRVTRPDGRMGIASSSNINDWQNVLKHANKLSKFSEKDSDFKGIPVKDEQTSVKLYDERLKDIDVESLKEQCDIMLSMAKDAKMPVQGVSMAVGRSRSVFANSNGVFSSENDVDISGDISVVLNGITGFSAQTFKRIPDFGRIANEAIEQCRLGQKTGAIKTGKYPVIMDYNVLNDLLSATFIQSINGYSILKNKSHYSGKLGEEVASSKLTIVDDPSIDYALYSEGCDAEGVMARKKVLVENGVLKDFLYDYYTSNLVTGTKPGNCSSLYVRPAISSSNLVITPGTKRKEDIISSTKKGVYVTEITGAHMINPASGDFSNDLLKAYYIENGEIKHSISNGMISGNVYDMLKNISSIGRDSEQRGSLITPVIKFDNLQIVA